MTSKNRVEYVFLEITAILAVIFAFGALLSSFSMSLNILYLFKYLGYMSIIVFCALCYAYPTAKWAYFFIVIFWIDVFYTIYMNLLTKG